jgi:hypothetical protein
MDRVGQFDWRSHREGNLSRGGEVASARSRKIRIFESALTKNETGRDLSRSVSFCIAFEKNL